MPDEQDAPPRLARRLGPGGALAIGVGSMLGTGVFAAWTPALDLAGGLLLLSLAVAGLVAALNAWSTAALARVHPEAGGAYAYGRHRLGRAAGATAGWAFVIGKVASAGAAALTIGAYVSPDRARVIGVLAIVAVLALDLRGVTRTAAASAVSSGIVLLVLAGLVIAAFARGATTTSGPALPAEPGPIGVLAAAGLLFVAFAGYARIATLGEEVRDPERTIPRAIAGSFAIVMAAYIAVGAAVLVVLGPLSDRQAAPLEQLASIVAGTGLAGVVRVVAVLAAGGALLSLLAGVGRTLFAMGRGGDAPPRLAAVSRRQVPHRGQLAAALGAAVVVAVGGIGGALALSAVSILLYYGIAHASAWLLAADEGRPPRLVIALGLVGCLTVSTALVLIAAGVA